MRWPKWFGAPLRGQEGEEAAGQATGEQQRNFAEGVEDRHYGLTYPALKHVGYISGLENL